ncbi:hypothetical protein Zm00014a_035308 [Zea mays]|uniref:Uncharacterized protein n=1 Tax=Zea mays TaxID=4577 RepID=A0A3L6F9Y0_MAIZE|nr:hypothetical protein Zm00014a_035308 [Zea mays]
MGYGAVVYELGRVGVQGFSQTV